MSDPPIPNRTPDATPSGLIPRPRNGSRALDRRGFLALAGVAVGATTLEMAISASPADASATQSTNVRDYGALGDGTADDTAAIESAFRSANGEVFFPAGNYRYAGSGLFNSGGIVIRGAGLNKTRITLAPGKTLVAGSTALAGLLIQDLTCDGGRGMVALTFTGTNVIGQYIVENVTCQNYTRVAIGHTASDMPYWKIAHCLFRAANNTTSIGVALNGLTDLNEIVGCSFWTNRVHVKLGYGGNNCKITHCDFIQYEAATPACPRVTGVWVVPNAGQVNAGQGLDICSNKFGNENLQGADYRILYADAGPGSFLDALPLTGADSTGFIGGHTVHYNLVNGGGAVGQPFVYTTTAQLIGCDFGPNTWCGTYPTYAVEYRSKQTFTSQGDNTRNWFGPYLFSLYDPVAGGTYRGSTNSTGVGWTRGARPTVTGGKRDNAALASLLRALSAQGIITDATT